MNPLANATSGVAMVYGQLDEVLGYLNEAGKIVAVVARNAPVEELDIATLEARKRKTTTSSSTHATSTSSTSHASDYTIDSRNHASNTDCPTDSQNNSTSARPSTHPEAH